jgi:hypothetical protein
VKPNGRKQIMTRDEKVIESHQADRGQTDGGVELKSMKEGKGWPETNAKTHDEGLDHDVIFH